VEKRFTICKSDLKVSPVYLHQDDRIASMLLLNQCCPDNGDHPKRAIKARLNL
jgi:hypothetical protein